MNVTTFVLGLVIVLAAWAGLVSTFVLPRGRSAFTWIARSMLIAVLWLFMQATRLVSSYKRKDAILAIVGPVGLLAQLVEFLALFLVGFALMEHGTAGDWGLSFRQVAAGLFTVGLAHVGGTEDDAVVAGAAATGAIAIALQIGYLPVIYQSYARRESLVTLLESRAGIPAWGPEVLLRHQLVATLDALRSFYGQWELWAADLAESHTTHPVLLLFRSPEPGYSWVLSLIAVLDAAALHLSLSPSSAPSEARLVLRMGFTALRRVAAIRGYPYERDPLPDGPLQLTYEEFAIAVGQLEQFGFPLERAAVDAWPHFRGWRVNYEQVAYRLADDLMAPHAPWSGPRRYLPAEVVLPDRPPHRNPDGGVIEEGRFRYGQPGPTR